MKAERRSDFAERTARALGQAGVDAEVVVTDNRVRMLSASRGRDGQLRVRVAAKLAALGEGVTPVVVGWALGRRGAARDVRVLLKQVPRSEARPRRAPRPLPHGEHHDLGTLLAAEQARYFPGETTPVITWGPRRRVRRQRSIRLGSYDPRFQLIRLNRRLDHPQVPAWLLGFVVYHELLHHVLGVALPDGRRRPLHGAEFRRREAQHHRYAEAMAWEATVLPRLLAGRL